MCFDKLCLSSDSAHDRLQGDSKPSSPWRPSARFAPPPSSSTRRSPRFRSASPASNASSARASCRGRRAPSAPTPRGRELLVYAEKLLGLRSEMLEAVGDVVDRARRAAARRRRNRRPHLAHVLPQGGARKLSAARAGDRGRHFPQPARAAARAGTRSRLSDRPAGGAQCAIAAAR